MATKSTVKPKKLKTHKAKSAKKPKPKKTKSLKKSQPKTESYDDLYKKIIDLELKIDEIEKIMSH
ncbi:MAG: hypothetical protein OEL84_02785 [Nitrosopumilus sp.]|nr:hypothetical protein [Nitrosopumilus sp.]